VTAEPRRGGFSRYAESVVEYVRQHKGVAGYCFVIDGEELGTGGCPMVIGADAADPVKYQARCRELVVMLRRSADKLELDLLTQGFGPGELTPAPMYWCPGCAQALPVVTPCEHVQCNPDALAQVRAAYGWKP